MTSEGLGEMFEGDSADTYTGNLYSWGFSQGKAGIKWTCLSVVCLSLVLDNFETCDWSTHISLVILGWLSLVRIRVFSDRSKSPAGLSLYKCKEAGKK